MKKSGWVKMRKLCSCKRME